MKNQFKIYKNQISDEIVNEILKEHERFKKSIFSFFRAQGAARFETPKIDEFNNQINSIHNPHLLGFFPNFRKLLLELFMSKNISNCLNDFYNFNSNQKFTHYQSMFFDKSTSTKIHQDTWYLDTLDNNLVGVWIALEDISMDSGPFCLYSNTDNKILGTDSLNYDKLEDDVNFHKQFPKAQRFDFCAKKGDILIWNSKVLHGSLSSKSPKMTRKSLTSHYYPLGEKIANPPTKRFFKIYNHKNPKMINKDFYSAATINPFCYQLLCGLLYFIGDYKEVLLKDNQGDKNLKTIRKI